jgi:hypothetical protein
VNEFIGNNENILIHKMIMGKAQVEISDLRMKY